MVEIVASLTVMVGVWLILNSHSWKHIIKLLKKKNLTQKKVKNLFFIFNFVFKKILIAKISKMYHVSTLNDFVNENEQK